MVDVLSHTLVGGLIECLAVVRGRWKRVLVISFAFIPDLPVLFVYPLLGHENARPYWIPPNSDWIGVRETHPVWSVLWEVPHSALFWVLVVVPLVLWLRLPRVAVLAYLSHILLDLPTHTGEWAIKPFYPFDYMFEGFTDAWAWPLHYMAVLWVVLGLLIFIAMRQRRAGEDAHGQSD